MNRQILLVGLLLSIVTNDVFSAEHSLDETIIINKPLSTQDTRYDYPKKLLQRILIKTQPEFGSWMLVESNHNMSRDRVYEELKKGERLHVMAEAPKPGWEEKLIPIRIPIRKGIQGFRTFLILKRNQNALSSIKSLEELKAIPTGSGDQWSTTKILESNGFNVVKGNNYEGLFAMLVNRRFVTFGRGINETRPEFEARKDKYPELSIEKDLLLYIPLPTYFFVTPLRPNLAKRIETGLIDLIDSGEFEQIFDEEFGPLLEKENLSGRRVFKLDNPNLSEQTPLKKREYWYQP